MSGFRAVNTHSAKLKSTITYLYAKSAWFKHIPCSILQPPGLKSDILCGNSLPYRQPPPASSHICCSHAIIIISWVFPFFKCFDNIFSLFRVDFFVKSRRLFIYFSQFPIFPIKSNIKRRPKNYKSAKSPKKLLKLFFSRVII